MVSVFWNTQGIIFVNYLEHGKTINSHYYIGFLKHYKSPKRGQNWFEFKKKLISPRQSKMNELGFELLLQGWH